MVTGVSLYSPGEGSDKVASQEDVDFRRQYDKFVSFLNSVEGKPKNLLLLVFLCCCVGSFCKCSALFFFQLGESIL